MFTTAAASPAENKNSGVIERIAEALSAAEDCEVPHAEEVLTDGEATYLAKMPATVLADELSHAVTRCGGASRHVVQCGGSKGLGGQRFELQGRDGRPVDGVTVDLVHRSLRFYSFRAA